VRAKAITKGKIADVLRIQGQVDAALCIQMEEVLPILDGLGDLLAKAVNLGRVADVLQARGEIDEALRIRREQELPTYEIRGDAQRLLTGRRQLALNLLARGISDDRKEATALLRQALTTAQALRFPDAEQIRSIQGEHGLEE